MRSIVLRSRNIPAHAGKLEVVKLPLANRRNIPAHAGKTLLGGGTQPPKSEHPRARGENEFIVRHYHDGEGTSPRTRGKLISSRVDIGLGKEHPRARGENRGWLMVPSKTRGTSPRTRGKPVRVACGLLRRRNIPAHAGKTSSMPVWVISVREHPRARGENYPNLVKNKIDVGTSPRTRGKPL